MKKKRKSSIVSSVLYIALFFVILFPSLSIVTKTQLAIEIPLFVLSTAILLFCEFSKNRKIKKFKQVSSIPLTVWFISFLLLFLSSLDYEFLYEPFIAFWEVSVIISIIIAVGVTLLARKRTDKKAKLVGCFFGILFAAMFTVASMAMHLNYLLDFTPPEELSVTILDKDYRHRRKGPDIREFDIEVDGKEYDINVDIYDYNAYEVGDEYIIEKYNGAFGKPFFIAKN